MFLSEESKNISINLRNHSTDLLKALYKAFENSIVGCSREIHFFRDLIKELKNELNSLGIPGVSFNCRTKEIHQKPIVKTANGDCELGDLLVVVKYHLPDSTYEAKSIIYQVKLANKGTKRCKIDQTQLKLLKDWPKFNFGKKPNGKKHEFNITPMTLEFGSYMLEPRDVNKNDSLPVPFNSHLIQFWFYHNLNGPYGICPSAWECFNNAKKSFKIDKNHNSILDVNLFFQHLLFQKGEPHNTDNVNRLIESLYRYIGLEPDPPDEFIGFTQETENDGFSVLEINVVYE